MNHRLILSLGALVALASGAVLTGFARPAHLVRAEGPPPVPAAPPVVAAVPEAPELPKPLDPEPITKAPRRAKRPPRNLAAVEPTDADLPPVPNIAAEPEDPIPAAPNIARAPSRPFTPPPAGNPFPVQPAAPSPADPNGVWQELRSTREQPEIRVYDRSGLPGALIITGGSYRKRWDWRHSGLVVTDVLPAGEYSYEIYGPAAADHGEPDIAGTLRCRRERRYEVRLRRREMDEPSGTIFTDIGDN